MSNNDPIKIDEPLAKYFVVKNLQDELAQTTAELNKATAELWEAHNQKHSTVPGYLLSDADKRIDKLSAELDALKKDNERLDLALTHQRNMAGLMLKEAERTARERDEAIARAEQAERNLENLEYKGNSVGHWYSKAKAYGDIVHGIGPKLGLKPGETLVEALDRALVKPKQQIVVSEGTNASPLRFGHPSVTFTTGPLTTSGDSLLSTNYIDTQGLAPSTFFINSLSYDVTYVDKSYGVVEASTDYNTCRLLVIGSTRKDAFDKLFTLVKKLAS